MTGGLKDEQTKDSHTGGALEFPGGIVKTEGCVLLSGL